jgi:hypothetical protein
MGKLCPDAVLDVFLARIDDADRLFVCSTQPTTYAEASATYDLATVEMTPGAGNGDFTLGDGDSPGRKVTIAQQANASITDSGTAAHVALGLTTGSVLLYVTTCTEQVLTSGGTVTIPAWDVEISDAT